MSSAADAAVKPGEPSLRAQIEYACSAGASRTTVDIVDDDSAITETLQLVLEAYGFTTHVFGSAEAFLESRPRDRQRSCLLLDVHLRGMSGFDLADRLSALGVSIPTVFMTGFDDGMTCQRARDAGAVAYLRKPFDNEVLVTALHWAGNVLSG